MAFTARHFISGLGSGVASAVMLQPLDLLKTRVQQSGQSSLLSALKDVRDSPSLVRSLWRGSLPSALRTGFGSALYFSSLNSMRQYLHESNLLRQRLDGRSQRGSSALPVLSNSANLLSGAAARTLAGFILMPLTVIKVRYESSFYSYSSLLDAARDIRARDGLRGFFSGFGATAIRDAPYAGMYVLFYEMLKTHLGSLAFLSNMAENGEARMRNIVASSVNFGSGMLAGAVCSAISNPFDAVKTRIQLYPLLYRNMWHAWSKMIREDGLRSLWDGLALRMCRKALSSALAWTVYEELIRRSWSL